MSENLSAARSGSLHDEPDIAHQFAVAYLAGAYLHVLDIVGVATDAQELTQEIFIEVFQRQGDRIRFGKSARLFPAIASATVQRFVRRTTPGTAQLIRSKDFASIVGAQPKGDKNIAGTPGWERFEREMLGNIAVGLAAVRCIEHVGTRRRLRWQVTLLTLLLACLFALAWMTHIPAAQTARLMHRLSASLHSHSRAVTLRSSPGSLILSERGEALRMKTEPSANTVLTGISQTSSDYVDEKTGQPMTVTAHAR